MATLPNRQLIVKLFDKEVTLDYPNTRGLINISIMKANISKQQYEAISNSNSADDTYIRFLINCIAVLSVLAPELEKTLNVKNYFELDPLDSSKLLKVYLKQIFPWMNEWQNALSSDPEEVAKKEKKD